jgi:hypothetical protein
MKNEKHFKKILSEMAAEIAEELGPNAPAQPDAKKVEDVLKDIAVVRTALEKINNATELGDVLFGIMPMMTVDTTQFINGLNRAVKLAAELKQKENPSTKVSKKDPNAMYDGMPKEDMKEEKEDDEISNLKEAYDKIRKK